MEAGYREHSLNGAELILSRRLESRRTIRQSFAETGFGRKRTHRPYDAAGFPDILRSMEFALEWELDDDYASTIEQIEEAKASAGPHRFVWWKRVFEVYTATAGQTVFYLPRPDAFNEAISGHTGADEQATILVNGVAVTHVYGTVDASTVVDTGEVWISDTNMTHADLDSEVTLFKFGDALAQGDIVRVEYTPVYAVQISDGSDSFEIVGREDKSVVFIEADV